MGVPKFYRWISERYPCLSEVVKEHQIPEFDNLYLDMNGIIHTCSHPNDDDPHFRITEEKIFKDIFHYLECLFRIIRPKRTFFMAVDGVAPRAKMNQQRGRRFMSAVNALNLAEEAKKRGEELPAEDRFDSNCITPGTEFMAKLHLQLQYFVRFKISTDEAWRGVKIYLSGHDVPGEGEHKIMDFIRYSRSQPDYDPNTRHCLYGLDADLMMLGLCSHEPHFSLLREEVKFIRPSKKQRSRTIDPEETTFHLLHLSLFREYLDFEFSGLKDKLRFPYDLESIIDDWVLMGFLVGNDFIPHLPHFHIHEGALPMVYEVYRKTLPTLDGYLNEGGHLNLAHFEKFLISLAQFDRDHFGDEFADMKYLESKTYKEIMEDKMRDIRTISEPGRSKRKDRATSSKNLINDVDLGLLTGTASNELKELLLQQADEMKSSDDCDDAIAAFSTQNSFKILENGGQVVPNSKKDLVDEDPNAESGRVLVLDRFYDVNDVDLSPEDDDEWSPEMELAFLDHKRRYYENKLAYEHVTPDVLMEQTIGYITAIQWNLHYYYNGCVSWSWYYRHHYSPYLSDIIGFSDLKIDFEIGEPFLPFQQLLAVLPSQSRKLLPPVYQSLMTNENSPIIDYYPTTFQTDLNGKKQDWEAIVLIPFIDEKRLLDAMKPYDWGLTEEERQRNACGETMLYLGEKLNVTVETSSYPSSLPGVFPDINNDIAQCFKLNRNCFHMESRRIKKGVLSNVRMDAYFPGFPTFKHIPVTHTLRKVDVKVFQSNSRNDSIVLSLAKRDELSNLLEKEPDKVADRLVGKEVYVNWPYLTVGLCSSLVTRQNVYTKDMDQRLKIRKADIEHFERHEQNIRLRYFNTKAVEIGDIGAIVYVRPLLGTRYLVDKRCGVKLEKDYADLTIPYVLESVVESQYVIRDSAPPMDHVSQLFPEGSLVFLLASTYYGCCGRVIADGQNSEPFKLKIRRETSPEREMASFIAARHAANKTEMKKRKILAVAPRVLYRPHLSTGNVIPDKETEFRLRDRVVNVRDGIAVPLGLRGTVVNIHAGYRDNQQNNHQRPNGMIYSYDFKVDVEFDGEFLGGKSYHGTTNQGTNSTAKRNGYRMAPGALINLSHGFRMELERFNITQAQNGQRPLDLSTVMTFNQGPVNNPKEQEPAMSIVTNDKQRQKETKVPVPKSLPSSAWNKDLAPPMAILEKSTNSPVLSTSSNSKFAQPACYIPPPSSDVDKLTKDPKKIFDEAKDRIRFNNAIKKANKGEEATTVNNTKRKEKYNGPKSVAEFFQRVPTKPADTCETDINLHSLAQSLIETVENDTSAGPSAPMELPIKHLFDQSVRGQGLQRSVTSVETVPVVHDEQKTQELRTLLNIGQDNVSLPESQNEREQQIEKSVPPAPAIFQMPQYPSVLEQIPANDSVVNNEMQLDQQPVQFMQQEPYQSAFVRLPSKQVNNVNRNLAANFDSLGYPPPSAPFFHPNHFHPMMTQQQPPPAPVPFYGSQQFPYSASVAYQQQYGPYPPSQPPQMMTPESYFQPITSQQALLYQQSESQYMGNYQQQPYQQQQHYEQSDYPLFVPMQVTRNQAGSGLRSAVNAGSKFFYYWPKETA